MRAPAHWSTAPGRPGLLARALTPLSWLWQAGACVRDRRAKAEIAPVPVLCIGNLIAGGSGKTPMVAALLRRLQAADHDVHVVSRGYGGRIAGPHKVDLTRNKLADVGDEPLLLAAHGPVWIAKDRAAGARAAAADGAGLVLLDDGFQYPGLVKDAAIVMVDAVAGFGNGRVIPAGPLREPVAAGLKRADLVVLLGQPDDRARARQIWPELNGPPLVEAQLVPMAAGMVVEGDPVFAFAGIGYPQKFFATLQAMGADLVGTRSFPDHHVYAPKMIRRMMAEAHAQNAMLVTTEKDAVRLPAQLRREVVSLQVRLEPEDWGPIDAIIGRILAK